MTAPTKAQQQAARTLGEILAAARSEKQLSYRDLREQTAISLAHLQRLERGEVVAPSPSTLHALAKALGLNYVALMRVMGYVS